MNVTETDQDGTITFYSGEEILGYYFWDRLCGAYQAVRRSDGKRCTARYNFQARVFITGE